MIFESIYPSTNSGFRAPLVILVAHEQFAPLQHRLHAPRFSYSTLPGRLTEIVQPIGDRLIAQPFLASGLPAELFHRFERCRLTGAVAERLVILAALIQNTLSRMGEP